MAALDAPLTHVHPAFDDGDGARASLGLIALATDRACPSDVASFAGETPGVAIYMTRIPFGVIATPETLAAQGDHLTAAAAGLVAGSPLSAIGFGCTSAGVAIGLTRAEALISAGRPDVPVSTAIGAAALGLQTLGARRIALLTPYMDAAHALVDGFLEEQGFEITRRANFNLPGDPEMNRVSAACLIETGRTLAEGAAVDALFISCTGLRTRDVIEPLEQLLGIPVVSSNQALTWRMLRQSGIDERLPDRGRLFHEV